MMDIQCEINGHQAHVRMSGLVGAPVVMLAHSILSDISMWDRVCELLQDRWHVVRYDLRGHGASSVTEGPYDMAMLADDAFLLISTLGLKRVHFVGASLGGMVGQRLAAAHGDMLASLTLSNTIARQTAPQAWSDRITLVKAQGTQALSDAMLQRWFSNSFLKANPLLAEKVRTVICSTPDDGFVGCAQAVLGLEHDSLLSEITLPTLVLSGTNDLAAPPSLAREMTLGIGKAHLVEMADGVHMSPVEAPDEYVMHLTTFLDSVTSNGVFQ